MSSKLHCTSKYRLGFTLVEVLIVVVILGIAGAIVVPNMLQGGRLGLQAAVRMVIADAVYAQNEAIGHQTIRRIRFDLDNNRYYITDGSGTTLNASWKAGADEGENFFVDFDHDQRFQNVKLDTVDFAGTDTLEFDALGSPKSGGTVELSTGTFRFRITVAPFTGQITVAEVAGG